jgi:hypothetical protein
MIGLSIRRYRLKLQQSKENDEALIQLIKTDEIYAENIDITE